MKHRLVLTLLACMLCHTAFAGAPIGMTIGTNSVKVLPRRGISGATAWTNGIAVAQGQIIKNDGYFYMAEATIASATNEPTHTSGVANSLRQVASYPRMACMIQNCSTNTVWVNTDADAEASKGMRLVAGGIFALEGYQNAFYAIADATNSLVTALDIDK